MYILFIYIYILFQIFIYNTSPWILRVVFFSSEKYPTTQTVHVSFLKRGRNLSEEYALIDLAKPQTFASFNSGRLDSCDSVCWASY